MAFQLTSALLGLHPLAGGTMEIVQDVNVTRRIPRLMCLPGGIPSCMLGGRGSDCVLSLGGLGIEFSMSSKQVSFLSSNNGRVMKRRTDLVRSSSIRKRGACISARAFRSPFSRYLCKLKRFRSNCLGIHNLAEELARIGARVTVPFIVSGGKCKLL